MTIRSFRGKHPRIHPGAFVEDSAQLIGDVEIGEDASIWFNTVVRGDVHYIRIGARTNIQDLSMVHVLGGRSPTIIGDDVTVGHHVVLHGCRIGNRVLVGMGAVLLDDVEVGDDCLVAAGSLVTPGTKIPAGMLALGSPARVKRELTPEEHELVASRAVNYVRLAREHRDSRRDER
jgi:carbonic anhydrase/acetyltransferase-like protein (isoleucine patch superfamily)